MKKGSVEDIHDRLTLVWAERSIYRPESEQYKELTAIGKLILEECKAGNRRRHVMHMYGTHYCFRLE